LTAQDFSRSFYVLQQRLPAQYSRRSWLQKLAEGVGSTSQQQKIAPEFENTRYVAAVVNSLSL
jgi:hypothetical protein